MTVEMMQELISSGILTEDDVKRAEMKQIKEALMKKGVTTPKITKRGKNKYVCNIPKRFSLDCKIHQVVGETEEDCAEKFQRAVYAFITEKLDKNRPFEDVCVEFLRKKKGAIGDTTLDQYNAIYRNHIAGTPFGQTKIQEIKLPECENYIKTLYTKNLSYGTIKLIKSVIIGVFDYAICHEYVTTNFMRAVSVNPNLCSTSREHKTDAWTDDELSAIRKTSMEQWNERKKYRHSALIMLMAFTGCRVGELLAAKWEDVDFKNKTFTINKNLVSYREIDSNRRVKSTHNVKTVTGRRTIQLTDEALFWFREVKRRSAQAGVLNEYVVVGRNGRQMDQPHIDMRIKTFCDAMGIPYKSAHSCRRSYATIMIDGGVPISEVAADLGHKNTSTTQNIYYKRRGETNEMTSKKNLAILATLGNTQKSAESVQK